MEAAEEEGAVGNLFEGVKKLVATPGSLEKDRRFHFVHGDSLNRYCRHAEGLVCMAMREVLQPEEYSKVPVSEEQRTSVERLLVALERERSVRSAEMMEACHLVLSSVLLCEGQFHAGPKELFVFAYQACICVQADRSGPRFRRGVEVASILAGIMYTASCAALLSITKYATLHQGTVRMQKCLEAIFTPGAFRAVGVLSATRAVCASLRDQEYSKDTYVPCTKVGHQRCGSVGGVELCPKRVGEGLWNMHKHVREHMMRLLQWELFPSWIMQGCENLRDNVSNRALGYSFQSDKQNGPFLQQCRRWVCTQVFRVLDAPAKVQKWKDDAEAVWCKLLTVMHLAGGAPGRGPELAGLAVRNTGTNERGPFLNGQEVFLAPGHSKQRTINGGVFKPVTRHLDSTSSRLVKLYIILIRPCIVEIVRESSSDKREMRDLHNLVVMRRSIGNKITSVIHAHMEKHGIPMQFGQYVQWFGGFEKHIGGTLTVQSAAANSITENEQVVKRSAAEEGLLLQGAHSVATAQTMYGKSAGVWDMDSAEQKHRFLKFRRASREWHLHLGVEPSFSEAESTAADRLPTPHRRTQYKHRGVVPSARMAPFREQPRSTTGERRNDERETSSALTSIPTLAITTSNDEQQASLVCSPVTPEAKRPREDVPFDALHALRVYTGVHDALFKSPEQREAMHAEAARDADVLVVLPTGGGKTAVATGPIVLESGATVWISPLRALAAETLQRLKRTGVQTHRLTDAFDALAAEARLVLIVSPEQVGTACIVALCSA